MPLASSTRMCFDTAFKDIGKGSATSVTRASPRESRSIIARRVGSANAANTASLQVQLDEALRCRQEMDRRRKQGKPYCVVSGYRDPLDQVVATLFQILPFWFPEVDVSSPDVAEQYPAPFYEPFTTLSWLAGNLRSRAPASLAVCAMLRKPGSAQMQVDVAYTGFDIGDEFVVGYGLDYAQRYRNLPFIGTLAPAVYRGS